MKVIKIVLLVFVVMLLIAFVIASASGSKAGYEDGLADKMNGKYHQPSVRLYSTFTDIDEKLAVDFFDYIFMKLTGFRHMYEFAYRAGYNKAYPITEGKQQPVPELTGGMKIRVKKPE